MSNTRFGAITLKQIRALAAVAELGSFSLAAQRLNLSQPAITAGIKIMEDQLGTRLLERTSRSVAVTPAGRMLLESAKPAMNQLEACFEAITKSNLQPEGAHITIGCLPSIAENVLPQAIARFVENNPDVSVTLTVAVSNELEKMVLDGKVDFAIAMLPGLSGIDASAFYDEPICLFCRIDDSDYGQSVTWRQLQGRVVLNTGFDKHVKAAVNAVPHADIKWSKTQYSVRSSRMLASLVQRGDVAILPRWSILPGELSDIATVPIIEPTLVRKLYILRRPGSTTPFEEAILSEVATAIAAE